MSDRFAPVVSAERLAGLAYRPRRGVVALAGGVRKSVDADRLTVQALLTYPVRDLAGDYVRPQGLAWDAFAADPAVDVEHSGLTVAWCRESLSRPGAPLAVEHHDLVIDGTSHRLPVATSYFDASCKKSMQVFRLVAEDKLPGVSLEFEPLAGRRLGKSTLEPRDAYEFTSCRVLRYTHCATPVNPGALTVTKAVDALLPVIQTGKLGGEQLDPALWGALKKSLSAYTPRRVTVRVEKAMPETDETPETVYDEAADANPGDVGAEAPATPTVQAHYDCAQMISDVLAHVRELLLTSEHVKGRQWLEKKLAKIEGDVEDIKANGDRIDGELAGGTEPPDGEPVGEEVEKDEEGVIKGIRPVYRKAIKRFSLAELKAAGLREAKLPPPEEAAALAAQLDELRRQRRLLERDEARYAG